MRVLPLVLALSAVVCFPAFAVAETPAPALAKPGPSAQESAALAFARTIAPKDLSRAQMERILETGMREEVAKDPDVAQSEADYPGMIQVLIDVTRAEVFKTFDADMEDLWGQLAKLYADNLAVEDIKAADGFYSGPVGRTLIRQTYEGITGKSALAVGMASGDDNLMMDALEGEKKTVATGLAKSLTKEEMAELVRFVTSSAGQKLVALNDRSNAIQREWSVESTPEEDVVLEAVVEDAMYAHMEKIDAEREKKPQK